MAYKVKIDNVEYDLKDGFTIKDELNETLDSAIVQFNTYGEEADFECFDYAEIYDIENRIETKRFLVDSYDDEIHSFGENFETDDHAYTTTFFSETKGLERITLPNYTVTQSNGLQRSVWWQIERVCSLYVPRIKVGTSNESYSYQRKYSLDPALQTRFNNIVCPEMQWNNPTLREVLNDLVSVDDCIIVVKEGIISFYDLKQRGNEIDVSKLSMSKKSMSSQDYAGELTIDMQNAIGHKRTVACEAVSLRAPKGEVPLTTDNGIIPTMMPIYDIKHLRVRFPTVFWDDSGVGDPVIAKSYGWEDITDRVLEKEEFDLLSNVAVNTSAYNNLDNFTDHNGITVKKHKVNFLYYERGKPNIYNFCTTYGESFWTNFSRSTKFAHTAMRDIADVHHRAKNIGTEQDPQIIYDRLGDTTDIRNTYAFDVEYESLAEHSLKVGKYLPQKHPENRIFDNQSNSYVDIDHQSIYEYAKVNRLGHKVRTILGDYANESEVPKLGDHIGDEILFSRELTYRDNLISFKGLLLPNYVLKNFFTGVKAKKRSWQIAKNEDALSRHDVYKIYIEASFNQKNDIFDYEDADGIKNFIDNSISSYLIPFVERNYYSETLGGCWVQTKKGDSYYPDQSNAIIVDSEFSIEGYSACLNFGFEDNHISAHYIRKEGNERLQNFHRYTDEKGEADEMTVILHNVRFNRPYARGGDWSPNSTAYEGMMDVSFDRPKISTTSVAYGDACCSFVLNLRKDNREITKATLQFEYCSDTSDIVITKHLLERIRYSNLTRWPANSEKVYFSTERYKIGDTNPKGYASENTIQFYGMNSIIVNGDAPEGAKSWGIVDNNGKLLVGVNFRENESHNMQIYFNFLRSRDDKIYKDTYSGVVVDNLAGNYATRSNRSVTETPSRTVRVQGRSIVRSETINSDNENE